MNIQTQRAGLEPFSSEHQPARLGGRPRAMRNVLAGVNRSVGRYAEALVERAAQQALNGDSQCLVALLGLMAAQSELVARDRKAVANK